jgi:hypothetical protein
VTDNAQLIGMPTPAHRPPAARSETPGETSEMLAPLAVYLLILLIACTLSLLIFWAYDTDGTEIEAGRSRPAVLEFAVHPHKRRFAAVHAALTHPLGDRPRSVVDQRRAARSLCAKGKTRPLRKHRGR